MIHHSLLHTYYYTSGGGEALDEDLLLRLAEGTAQGDTLPSAANQLKQSTLTTTLKTDENWEEMDVAWLLANDGSEEFGRLNLKNPATFGLLKNGTIGSNSSGAKGDGSTGYYNTQWNASVNGVKFLRDNNSFGLWCTEGDIQAAKMAMGAILLESSGQGVAVNPRNTSDVYRALNNNSTIGSIAGATTALGLTSVVRVSSTHYQVYKNGVAVGSPTAANSSAIVNLVWYLLAVRQTTNPGLFYGNRVAFAYAGSGAVDQLKLYNALNTYLS